MLSPRFIKRISTALAVLLVAGCATVPSGTVRNDDADAAPARDVPARAQTMYEQAAASMAAGDLIDAELRFKEFLLTYPDFPGAHVNLAIIHGANGNDEAAMAAVNAALAIDAEHVPALNQLGVLHRKNGNFTESEAAYLKAVTVQPDYPLAHYNLGVLNELYLQRLDMALQHFERYQELVGEDKQVGRWITDLQRRVAANQRTANVTE
ncbi:MAG: tetratricopeptide repeat protein [Pseudomonadota bacterium]